MTWVYRAPKSGILFPRASRKNVAFKEALRDIYTIKGRQYDVKNVAAGGKVVMIELVESYPAGRRRYRTPLVLVLEFSNGKVLNGRHYCDPNLSRMKLPKRVVERAFA